ncbi:MAG: hydroxymethylbilane synthase [Actinobacteria bacterium]|nr:MAG: hydroxymethylbilane synthase [Actinomycetota bacterium]
MVASSAVLLRVGSRGSRLALAQAELAAERLRRPGAQVALVPITTAGDRDRTRPFGEIGSRGVFVKEIEEALLDGRVDVAVHSAKDMTSSDTEGLVVGAYMPREDPRDALCGAAELRPGMRVGTASVRRRAQLLALEPTLSVEPLRGNVDTRLRKRRERGLDAVVLAACGLDRLGLSDEIGLRFDPADLLPEAGQGALALQVRSGAEELVAAADDAETRRRVEAERACVALIGGGCLAPVAAHHDGETLTALVADEDGRWLERRSGGDPAALAAELVALAGAAGP